MAGQLLRKANMPKLFSGQFQHEMNRTTNAIVTKQTKQTAIFIGFKSLPHVIGLLFVCNSPVN